ncbi:hypothetical protein HYX18_00865 [Candidatus Woesearchaeota archaeon]|nr:hypothetical protein [Candidatus Woesearchaeota archaeon]
MFGFNKQELEILKKLNSPKKIQNFLDKLKINFELNGETCMSPRLVLRTQMAHCFEGALLAAATLRVNGRKPLIVDLATARDDQDHVIAIFKENGCWGAITKTNHYMLRYRDPIYKTIKELVMSYFHEYYDDYGNKNLRAYSMPIDLSRFDKHGWMTSEDDVWYIYKYLFKVPHKKIMTNSQILKLRKADEIEIKVGKIVEWKK